MDRHIDRHSLQDRTQSMAGYFEGNPLVIKTSIEFEETHTVTETECLKQEITMQSGYWTKNTKDMSATMKRQSSVLLTNESRFAFAKQHAVFCTYTKRVLSVNNYFTYAPKSNWSAIAAPWTSSWIPTKMARRRVSLLMLGSSQT